MYVTGRLTRAQPDDWSSLVMSRWRRSMWRLSIGGGLRVRRRSTLRRSRTTSLVSSANTCLRYRYCFGSVRDTMKTKSAMIAPAGFQTLTCFRPVIHSRTDARRRAPGAVQWEAEWSEDSATREPEGGLDVVHESCGHTVALTHALLGDLMGIHS